MFFSITKVKKHEHEYCMYNFSLLFIENVERQENNYYICTQISY